MKDADASPSRHTGKPVLLVSLAEHYGGADVRVVQIARALHGQRPYAVAVLQGSETHRLLQRLSLNALPLPFSRLDPRNFWALFRFMRANCVVAVETHNPQSHFWGLIAAQAAGVRTKIWTVHSDYRKTDRTWKSVVLRELLRLGGASRCQFIVVSRDGAEHLRTIGVPGDQIHLIHNAIFQPQMPGPASLRTSLNWTREAKVVCIAARIDVIKGHSILFRALDQLRGCQADIRCLVLGDGPEKDALQRLVATLCLEDIVHFAGFRTDVHALMAECDVFCLPSLSEGLPFALLEAALMEMPIVVTQVGEIPNHFRHEDTARIVPPANPATLAREILWVIEHCDEAAEMARRAKQMVLEHFLPARMIAETLAVYDRESGPDVVGASCVRKRS